MKHRMTWRSREAAVLLWTCVVLFALRVLGQFEALTLAPDWLPRMEAWYSGVVPYYLLLPVQVLLLMVMAVIAWNRRIRTGRFAAAHPRAARMLRIVALVYFGVMALRLGVNVAANGAEFWSAGAIPVAFHWVLALFILVTARAAPLPSAAVEVIDELPHGDIPSLAPSWRESLASR